jgi:hypothetical protein
MGPQRPVDSNWNLSASACVKSVVTLHGGTVEARGDGAGRGSELVVRLPARSDACSEQKERARVAPAQDRTLEARRSARRLLEHAVSENIYAGKAMARPQP